jgi:histidine triad (HIT) family protein
MNYSGNDIYCDLILTNKLKVEKVFESDQILAFHHTKPFWQVHIVIIPKEHISSLVTLTPDNDQVLLELMDVIKQVANDVTKKHGAARVLTNLGQYQDSKHLHFHVSFGDEV